VATAAGATESNKKLSQSLREDNRLLRSAVWCCCRVRTRVIKKAVPQNLNEKNKARAVAEYTVLL